MCYNTQIQHNCRQNISNANIYSSEKILKMNLFCCYWICSPNNWKISALRNVFFLKKIFIKNILETNICFGKYDLLKSNRPMGI